MAALVVLIACIIFVLAAFGVTVGDTNGVRMVAAGLAFVAAGLLLPGALPWIARARD